VVGAAEGIVQHLAHTEFGSAMQAAIVVRENPALRISPEHKIEAEAMQADRPILHVNRLAYRIPHVPETQFQFSLKLDVSSHFTVNGKPDRRRRR
jgi:hypothetical protein